MASLTSSDPIPIATMIHMVTIKLSSSNYLLWRRQVMPMLTSFDLLGHVDGTSAAPERTVASSSDGQPALNPAYATWHTKDQKLLGVLFSTLSEEAMAEVVDCNTSRDAWIALEAAFSHSSSTRDGYGSGQNRPQDRHISTNTSTSLTCKLAMSSRAHKGKCINMGANEDDETPESLKKRLSNYRKPIRSPFIYKVHSSYLRGSNDNIHEPRIIAIGPYHHGKKSLKMMEEHKLIYLQSLLLRKNESVDRYLSAIAEIEKKARSCYAEELNLSTDEFIEMLVIDGCFIIELLRKIRSPDSSCASDPIFLMEWLLCNLSYDLVLFENQIPFFVLCKIFDLINGEGEGPSQQRKLIDSIFYFLPHGSLFETDEEMPVLHLNFHDEVMHVLHLEHATMRPSSDIYIKLKKCPNKREFQWIPSATELKDANIKFRKSEVTSSIPFGVDFSNGVLTMSTLIIHDGTDGLLRNLILYEQYFHGNRPTYVTDYLVVLDCLVNTGHDVEILCRYGIINNMTGHNQMAADIINRLKQYAVRSQTYFIYADTFSQINEHHKTTWNRAMAALNRDYFNSPWAYFSFVAAVLLLLLTLAQTVISAVQL